MNLPVWLQSSQNPEEVANKVKGFILMVSSAIIFIAARYFHLSLEANDVSALATELGTVVGAIWTIYGSILHVITFVSSKKDNRA